MIKRIFREFKLNPELLAIPLVILGWFQVKGLLLLDPEANAIIPDDIIQIFILAMFGLLLGNFITHLGIKYNNPTLWKEYKEAVLNGTKAPQEYYSSVRSYLFAYVGILIALM